MFQHGILVYADPLEAVAGKIQGGLWHSAPTWTVSLSCSVLAVESSVSDTYQL